MLSGGGVFRLILIEAIPKIRFKFKVKVADRFLPEEYSSISRIALTLHCVPKPSAQHRDWVK